MILVIDNYDSFTYNLVQYLGELGAALQIFRNDAISLDALKIMHFSHIYILRTDTGFFISCQGGPFPDVIFTLQFT